MRRLKPRFCIENALAFLFKRTQNLKLTCVLAPEDITPESEITHQIAVHLILLAAVFCGGFVEPLIAPHFGGFGGKSVLAALLGTVAIIAFAFVFAIVFVMIGMYCIFYRHSGDLDNKTFS
ncbi:MAG: hypothetical protein IKZ82_03965 [Clostridia bacterium]|nr:hypothetical protein [Clostridia bacterium]